MRAHRHVAIVKSQSNECLSATKPSCARLCRAGGDRLLHEHIGAEHLLLGLFREEHGMAATILAEQGLRIATVRDQIVEMSSASIATPAGSLFMSLPLRPRRRVLRSRRADGVRKRDRWQSPVLRASARMDSR